MKPYGQKRVGKYGSFALTPRVAMKHQTRQEVEEEWAILMGLQPLWESEEEKENDWDFYFRYFEDPSDLNNCNCFICDPALWEADISTLNEYLKEVYPCQLQINTV